VFSEKNGDPAAKTGNINNKAIRGSVTFKDLLRSSTVS